MALPKIYNPSPVEQPATEAKTYPDSYLHRLVVKPNRDGTQTLVAVFRPYNYASGELYPGIDRDVELTVDDLMAEAAATPLLGQAVGAIIQVGSLMLERRTLDARIAALSVETPATYTDEETGETVERTQAEIDALEAERTAALEAAETRLTEVLTALGVN